MHQRGIHRPYQNVIYLYQPLVEQLEFNKISIFDIEHFATLNQVFSDEHFLTLLALNANNDDVSNPLLPNAIGIATLLRLWQRDLNDNELMTIKRLQDNLLVKDNIDKILNKVIMPDSQSELCYQLKHNPELIIIQIQKSLENREKDSSIAQGLSDKDKPNLTAKPEGLAKQNLTTTTPSLQDYFKPLHNGIVRSVIDTYNQYHNYHDVANTSWFKLYIDQL